jgi:hypothetical protein
MTTHFPHQPLALFVHDYAVLSDRLSPGTGSSRDLSAAAANRHAVLTAVLGRGVREPSHRVRPDRRLRRVLGLVSWAG